MPSSTFPRPSGTEVTVETVTKPILPAGLVTTTQAGLQNLRRTQEVGWEWSESYNPVRGGDPVVEQFLSYLDWAHNQMQTFSVKHLEKPGSGVPPNGLGTTGVTVNGASQTGTTIDTTGWPASTNNVARAGDWIRIAGLGFVTQVTEDASSDVDGNATLAIVPGIYEGNAPADGASVTTTGVEVTARIKEMNRPETTNAFYYGGLSITFVEVPD